MSDRRLLEGMPEPRPDPSEVIPPTKLRHRPPPKESPEENERSADMNIRFRRVALSHLLGLEIQAACGLHPPDKAQRGAIKTCRKLAYGRGARAEDRKLPDWAVVMMDEAFQALLEARACSHCEARHECPSVGRRLH